MPGDRLNDAARDTKPNAGTRRVSRLHEALVDEKLASDSVCVTCHLSPGRERPTRRFAVVCGPCWSAHGGKPGAAEMGPAPTETVPSWDPRDQAHWLRTVRRAAWVQDIRIDGQAHLLRICRVLALHADWRTLETRPTWDVLTAKTGLHEKSVARWLQELRVRGHLAHIERGSTPATRPASLAHLEGNRAAVYGLRIPLSPAEAVARAAAHAVAELEERLAADAAAEVTARRLAVEAEAAEQARREATARALIVDRVRALIAQAVATSPHEPDDADALMRQAHALMTEHAVSAAELRDRPTDLPESVSDQPNPASVGDKKATPSWSFQLAGRTWVGGYARARRVVDELGMDRADPWGGHDQTMALRARFDQEQGSVWAVTVPTSGFQMLVAADWLRRHVPVFARPSRKAVRAACRPFWRAGWSNRDVAHAMDHRPGVFSQVGGVPVRGAVGDHVDPITARHHIAARLAAWRHPATDQVLPGGYQAIGLRRAADAAIRARHGKAGAELLRRGEISLTAERITEHGRRMAIHDPAPLPRPSTRADQEVPAANAAVRAVAVDTVDQVLADRRAQTAGAIARAELHARFGPQLAAARAELAARTGATTVGTPAAPVDDDQLTAEQRYERARARAVGHRRARRR